MSLLLNSLKKADEAGQDQQAPEEVGQVDSQLEGSAGPSSVDFDSLADDSAGAGAGVGAGLAEGGDEERRELVSATRVFRAGGEEEDEGGGGRRALVALLAVVLIGGGGAGVVASGLIPGVSFSSLLGFFGEQTVQVVEQQSAGPQLEAANVENAALSLPRPVVDVQSEIVTFAGFREEGSLETPEGRREFAEKIAILTGQADEEAAAEEARLAEQQSEALGVINLQIEGSEILEEEELLEEEEFTVIKTAEVSRDRRHVLDAQTPSDRVLERSLKLNGESTEPVVIAQASDSDSDADSSSASESQTASESQGAVEVQPSLQGVDRRRMLNDAGRLYVGGDYPGAEAVYRSILAKSATNIDALRGLALVAVATGRYQLAVGTYLRILEYYPNDPVAIADLTNLHGVTGDNFYAIEGALKKALGERPEWDSRLHFALGNLYAGAGRWLDAQNSYFDAHSQEQSNPDYAYNLAVVLDYLNKPGLAVTYYRQALELSERAPSGFNVAQVRARIHSISQ